MMNSSPPPQVLTFEDARHAEASEGWLGTGQFRRSHRGLDWVSPKDKDTLRARNSLAYSLGGKELGCMPEAFRNAVELNPGEAQH
jgi:hypothetical protein